MSNLIEQSRIAQILRADAERAISDNLNMVQGIHERLQGNTRYVAQAGEPRVKTVPPARPTLTLSKVSLPVALVLGLGIFAVLYFSTSNFHPASESNDNTFVPQGKIRHNVIDIELQVLDPQSNSGQANGPTSNKWTEERWFANGKSHLLMREKSSQYGTDKLVGEDSVWTYMAFLSTQPTSRTAGDNNAVWKTPFEERQLQQVLLGREVVAQLLKQPNTRLVQSSPINGRPSTLVESLGNWYESVDLAGAGSTPVVVFQPLGFMVSFDDQPAKLGAIPAFTTSPPIAGQTGGESIDYKLWLDSESYQVLQEEYVTKYSEGAFSGKVLTYTKMIALDEVKDAKEYPADLFTLMPPQGIQIKDALPAFSRLVQIAGVTPTATLGTKP